MKRILFLCLVLATLVSCNKEEFDGYDNPFVSIATETGASSITVLSNVNNINTYMVLVSSRPLETPLTVNYQITVGDGLEEGVDYELVTTGNSLVFEPGVYDMPVRIRWMSHPVDESKDNTLTITLTSNSKDFTLGLPGKSGYRKSLVIEKKN
ncbi:hypothetical protein [Prevotella sp. KH2C16]|uniref:hypothetical protein n=1 Tax=Prevotella sp. KH2C16 TaxID=1855325 RepID=UPI0008F1E0D9|nr:hypothetical protein [Prevotella sp. KH2C16]SFF83028.1 hypothetical protein SAMN05216383_101115 [Prevotella sp. KH2C16]